MAVLVICSYRPHEGQSNTVRALMARHVPLLQGLGFATAMKAIRRRHEDGSFIEIFEWESRETSAKAATHPDVQKLWGEFAAVCDFIPLADLKECQTPFAHFDPI